MKDTHTQTDTLGILARARGIDGGGVGDYVWSEQWQINLSVRLIITNFGQATSFLTNKLRNEKKNHRRCCFQTNERFHSFCFLFSSNSIGGLMLMRNASLSKAFFRWFGLGVALAEITHTWKAWLIIVVKPGFDALAELDQERHHQIHLISRSGAGAMEAMRQHLLAVAVSFWVEVIYICWHLPRRIDFTRQFLLVISSSFLMSVIIFSHSIMKPLGKQLECSDILESSRNKLYWTPVRVSSLGITGITGTLARKWPACSDCQWPLTRGIVTSTRID